MEIIGAILIVTLLIGGLTSATESDKEHSSESDVKVCMMCVDVHSETNTRVNNDQETVK